MKRIIRILWIAIKNCWKSLGGYMIILLVCAGCSVAYTMIQRNMINELVASIGGEKMDIHFVFLVVIYVCVFFVYNSGGFLVTLGNNIFRFRVDALFQKFFLLQAHNLKQEMFFNSEFMDKYEFIGKNINKISTMINDLMMLLFYRGGIILGSLVLFLLYEPTMVIYMLCYTIVSMIIYRRTSRLEYDLDKKQMHEQRKSEYYRDSLMNKENAKEVRILGIKKILYNEWNQWFHNINLTKIKMQTKKTTLENVVTVIQNLLQMAGIIFITGFTLFGRIDVGTFVMLIGLLKRCSEDIDYCIGNAVKVYNSAMYICDYYEFVEPVIFFDVNESNRFLERSLQWGEFQDLSVKEVNYHYPEKLRTIENINLSIKRGEIICIIGYNGSGKTTLSKIITGSLSPQSGEIRINGHTITDADRDHVFMYFGIVPQEYARYSIQIREVVGLGDIAYIHDKNRIKESLQKVGADQWVEQFPGKEETLLGKECDEGIDLSGGQWKQLAIASAYVGDPEILMMDEPTSSLDPIKEKELIRSFRSHIYGKTAIVISHKVGFARIADQILVLQDGCIIESGRHEELMQKKGYYYKIFEKQKSLYEEGNVHE